jgi:NAD(P)-dependent dehydrogenase (short-subunit alcohol dehydrogenase family)
MSAKRILLAGASGTLGTAVAKALLERGHTVVAVGRSSGDHRADLTDPAEVARLYASTGPLDAVVSTLGKTPFKPVGELTPEDYLAAYREKVAPQIELVRQGLAVVAERGSFTLTTGVLARDPILTGSAAAMAGGALESFVRAIAGEIAPLRINAVSPSVLVESLNAYDAFFPGFPAVPAAEAARAFVRSLEGIETGRVFELP